MSPPLAPEASVAGVVPSSNKDSSSAKKSTLSKQDKGRLKKLLKRASTVDKSSVYSGIVNKSDWNDLNSLLQQRGGSLGPKNIAPKICWKDGRPRNIIDAASQRDLLLRLTTTTTTTSQQPPPPQTNNSKKRKRDPHHDDSSSSKSLGWTSLHNVAAVKSVGVLELHVDTLQAVDWLRQRVRALVVEQKRRTCLVVPTCWFQETRAMPQSISDALLYKAAPKEEQQQQSNSRDETESSVSRNLEDLVTRMDPLRMTREELEQNGYPIATSTEKSATTIKEHDDLMRGAPVRPQAIALDEAEAFVRDFFTETECHDPQNQLPPYVVDSVSSSKATTGSSKPRSIFAMDAEMVETRHGKELARITLCRLKAYNETDIESELVFDTLVKPRNAVLNYWTQYSGVTAAMLNDSNNANIVRLQQVQAALLRTVTPEDIVIGHSLENDLQATRWIHGTVIDTAVLFRPTNRSHKYSLRHLAAVLLHQQIQQSHQSHCSEEDAITALHLAVQRAVQGPKFRIHVKQTPTNWLAELSTQKEATVVAIGSSAWLQKHVLSSNPPNTIHALQCDSLHDANAKALESWLTGPRRRASVVWAAFGLRKSANASVDGAAQQPLHRQDVQKLEERLESLLTKMPLEAALLFAIQPGFQAADELTQSRRVRQNPKTTASWSDTDEENWRGVVQACRKGSVLWVSGSLVSDSNTSSG